jgi:hypothetical protein
MLKEFRHRRRFAGFTPHVFPRDVARKLKWVQGCGHLRETGRNFSRGGSSVAHVNDASLTMSDVACYDVPSFALLLCQNFPYRNLPVREGFMVQIPIKSATI